MLRATCGQRVHAAAAVLTAHLNVSRQVDGELGGSEDMLRLGPGWQGVAGGHPPDEGALARLAYPKIASIQDPKPHLKEDRVSHH